MFDVCESEVCIFGFPEAKERRNRPLESLRSSWWNFSPDSRHNEGSVSVIWRRAEKGHGLYHFV